MAIRNLVSTAVAPTVVAVVDGYDAATYDQRGHINFWQQRGTGPWNEVSRCSYQLLPGDGPPYMFQMRGRQLPGMADATFIAVGEFTGDSSGDFIAFTRGRKGWGALALKGRGTLEPIGCSDYDDVQGEHRSEGFSGGELQTVDAAAMLAPFPSVTDWSWRHGHFIATGGNAFRSVLTSAPGAPTSKLGLCDAWASDAKGAYNGYLQALSSYNWAHVPSPDIQVLVSSRPGAAACLITVSPTTSLVVQATRAPAGHAVPIWVTVPAWWLEAGESYPSSLAVVIAGQHLYHIKSALGVPIGPWVIGGTPPSGVYCQLSLKGGAVTSISLVPRRL